MDTSKILSGSELVARGVTKNNVSLPEAGQKEISSSGSWLESKQIQSALEARKHLLEVERIEKLGSLSVAIWSDNLRLAEVIKKAGSHWQYIGHNIGKHLYLRPEETLFLIEINCLLLKHNDVTVSLQKAYTLCLGEINLAQYKVYACLSRLGYRVFRHRHTITQSNQQAINNEINNQGTAKNINNNPKIETSEYINENLPTIEQNACGNKDGSGNISTNRNTTPHLGHTHIGNTTTNLTASCSDDVRCENPPTTTTFKVENTTHCDTNPKKNMAEKIDEIKICDDRKGSVISENQGNVPIENTVKAIDPNSEAAGDERTAIHKDPMDMDYNPLNNTNIENSSIVEQMDVDFEKTDNITQKSTNALQTKNNETVKASTKDTKECYDVQNTVIVTTNGNENLDNGETNTFIVTTENNVSNATHVESKMVKNVEIDTTTATENKKVSTVNENMDSAGATVIVSTKNNMAIPSETLTATEIRENIDEGMTATNEAMNSQAAYSEGSVIIYSVDEIGVIRVFEPDMESQMETDEVVTTENNNADGEPNSNNLPNRNSIMDNLEIYVANKMQKLINRQMKPTQKVNENEKYVSIPDCFEKNVITVTSPHVELLPRNIFLMKTAYVLDLKAIRTLNSKNRSGSNAERSFDGDCSNVNEARHLSVDETSHNAFVRQQGPVRHPGNPNPPLYPIYQQYCTPPIWNSRPFMLHHNYGRPCYPQYRPIINYNNINYTSNPSTSNIHSQHNPRKRVHPKFKAYHLSVIKNLVERIKLFTPAHIQDLVKLVKTFNRQYNENYELTEDFKFVDLNEIREVIVLDDDGESKSKKSRPNDDNEVINKHLETLKSLAAKLKDLEAKKLSTSRHKRVLSNAIKVFNKNFNADIYMNSNFEIIDSKLITLDSSSDSDSVVAVEENSTGNCKGKKLRNPFNVLKRSGRINEGASTSREVPILQQLSLNVINEGFNPIQNNEMIVETSVMENMVEGLLRYFNKSWLPSDEDFGRAELRSRLESYMFEVTEAEYLRAYCKYRTSRDFQNWLELKITFMGQAQERIKFRKQRAVINDAYITIDARIQPLVGSDSTDIMSVLEKLQIIPSTMEVSGSNGFTNIEVDFDVYYGHSPSFRKTNRPKPNFRVVCVDVSDDFLSSKHIDAFCSKYSIDNVPLIIAAVGVGSVSYMQINDANIPIYIPDNFF